MPMVQTCDLVVPQYSHPQGIYYTYMLPNHGGIRLVLWRDAASDLTINHDWW
jgi:hypothetical protein